MPRLIGKKQNYGLLVIPAIAATSLGVLLHLEYRGVVDVIPRFGSSSSELWDGISD